MMIVRLVLLPALSLAGIGLAAWTVRAGNQPTPKTPALTAPAASPFAIRVSATGIVEASSHNIGLGVAHPGLVTQLPHDIGSSVAAGDLLLQIDDRDTRARLVARQAELTIAQQELQRQRSLPRAEDVEPRVAAVGQRRAQLQDAQNLLDIVTGIADARAISREDRSRRESAVQVAQQTLAEAEAELALTRAGAWAPDLAIAAAKVTLAEAAVDSVRAELDQLQVKAPFAGKVLQVNVRVGEFANTSSSDSPAIVLGDVTRLHIRADVDEMDVWRLHADAPARAFVRGNAQLSAALRFVAIEPLMIPKRALSGSSREQVDTRVMQVIYALDPKDLPVQVGQLVDVFVESTAAPGGAGSPDKAGPK